MVQSSFRASFKHRVEVNSYTVKTINKMKDKSHPIVCLVQKASRSVGSNSKFMFVHVSALICGKQTKCESACNYDIVTNVELWKLNE